MKYDHPFFVTPHAVEQFQKRIRCIPAADVIDVVQNSLQRPELVELPIFRGYYARSPFYMVVGLPESGEWPSVVTILGAESRVHGKLMKQRRMS